MALSLSTITLLDGGLTPTYAIVHCSPLGIDHHEFSRMLSTLFCFCDLLLAQFLDRPRLVNVRAVRASSEDGADESRTVLIGSGQECADGLAVRSAVLGDHDLLPKSQ